MVVIANRKYFERNDIVRSVTCMLQILLIVPDSYKDFYCYVMFLFCFSLTQTCTIVRIRGLISINYSHKLNNSDAEKYTICKVKLFTFQISDIITRSHHSDNVNKEKTTVFRVNILVTRYKLKKSENS